MIKASFVGLRYDSGPEILSDISLRLEEGSFHFLTGPSGSGKTSLMSLLHLSKLPSRGDVTIFEQDVTRASRMDRAVIRRKIGVIFQNFRLMQHLNVYDNIALPLRLADLPEAKIKIAVTEMAEWIGLKDYLFTKPPLLSGGQQQRVAIARAVITKPRVLLADEPTGNLDDPMGDRIMTLFEELNKSGTAILVATHNQGMIKRFKHPVLKLKNGTLT